MPASDLSPAYFNHLKVSDMFQLDDISLNRTVHVPSPAKQLQPQEIIGIEPATNEEGRKYCAIELAPELVMLEPRRQKAFQGWRYLKPEDAPADLSSLGDAENLPPHIRMKLVELGAW